MSGGNSGYYNNSFPGWGGAFSYSPNAGPAYARPRWPGSFPDGGSSAPPAPSDIPTPPQFNWGGYGGNPFMRPPPYTGPQTPARPSTNPGAGTGTQVYGDSRPVSGSTGMQQPVTNGHWMNTAFSPYPQSPGGIYSVGPATQPNTGTNPPNTGTTPGTVGPGRPGGDPMVRQKSMQGQIVSDNFDTPDQGSAPPGLFNTLATGQGGGAFAPAQINAYGPGSGGWGQFLNWYAQNNAMLNRQGPMYQPGGIFYGR